MSTKVFFFKEKTKEYLGNRTKQWKKSTCWCSIYLLFLYWISFKNGAEEDCTAITEEIIEKLKILNYEKEFLAKK